MRGKMLLLLIIAAVVGVRVLNDGIFQPEQEKPVYSDEYQNDNQDIISEEYYSY